MSDSLAAPAEPLDTFRVGAAFSRSLSLFFSNLLIFLPLACIPGIPGLFIANDPVKMAPSALLTFVSINLIVFLVFYPLIQTTILHAAFQIMRGRPSSLAASLSTGLRRFVPILGTLICVGFMVMVGMVFLIVPGIMLFTRYYVAIPACVVDRTGPSGSMKRSADLTSGNRWRIFGLFLLIILASAVIGVVAGIAGSMAGGVLGSQIVRFVVNAFALAFGSVIVAVVYHDLRVAKEGVDTDRIAAVFD